MTIIGDVARRRRLQQEDGAAAAKEAVMPGRGGTGDIDFLVARRILQHEYDIKEFEFF